MSFQVSPEMIKGAASAMGSQGGGFGEGTEALYASQGDTWTKYLSASKEMQTLRKKKEAKEDQDQSTPASQQVNKQNNEQVNVNAVSDIVDGLNKDNDKKP